MNAKTRNILKQYKDAKPSLLDISKDSLVIDNSRLTEWMDLMDRKVREAEISIGGEL